ncbi:MAG: hypothetical protein K2Q26_15715 [Bdellovibrionales bacterium]|nr:hypothetical protein [Bdellovibrionales bacterium]
MAVLLVFSLLASISFAQESKRDVELKATQLRFEFASQDGDLLYQCTHEFIDSLLDYSVTCFREEAPDYKWNFIVHPRLFVHERPQPPHLSYELLFWVTDRQLTGGHLGQFLGTTLWLHLQDATPLMGFEIGQDVQNTFVLRMHVRL